MSYKIIQPVLSVRRLDLGQPPKIYAAVFKVFLKANKCGYSDQQGHPSTLSLLSIPPPSLSLCTVQSTLGKSHHQLDPNVFTFTTSGKFIRKDLELVYYEIARQGDNLSELPAFSICI